MAPIQATQTFNTQQSHQPLHSQINILPEINKTEESQTFLVNNSNHAKMDKKNVVSKEKN